MTPIVAFERLFFAVFGQVIIVTQNVEFIDLLKVDLHDNYFRRDLYRRHPTI